MPLNFEGTLFSCFSRIQLPIPVAVQPAQRNRSIRDLGPGQTAIPISIQGKNQAADSWLDAIDDNVARWLGVELGRSKLCVGDGHRQEAGHEEKCPYFHPRILSQTGGLARSFLSSIPHDAVKDVLHGGEGVLQKIMITLKVFLDLAEQVIDLLDEAGEQLAADAQ